MNWNPSAATLTFQVDGLAQAPAVATFTLPALAFAAVEIPDVGPAFALGYSETERQAGLAPQPLSVQ